MTILAYHTGGLANRIKNMVACFRLDPIVLVFWQKIESYTEKNNHLFICKYYDLFSYPFQVENLEQGKEYPCYDTDKLLIGPDDGIPENFAKFDNKCDKPYVYQDELNRNIDFEYERIPIKVQKLYSYLFKQVLLNEDLQQKINEFYESHLSNKNLVSVHIRSWNRENEQGRKHLFNLEKFIDRMKYFKDCHYFVTSDSSDVLEKVKEQVDNVITYPRETDRESSRENPKGLQEDLIELYLLAKGDVLVGSYFSSYTEVAWYLMDCRQIFIVQ